VGITSAENAEIASAFNAAPSQLWPQSRVVGRRNRQANN